MENISHCLKCGDRCQNCWLTFLIPSKKCGDDDFSESVSYFCIEAAVTFEDQYGEYWQFKCENHRYKDKDD